MANGFRESIWEKASPVEKSMSSYPAISHSLGVLFSSSIPCLKGSYIGLSEANLDIA